MKHKSLKPITLLFLIFFTSIIHLSADQIKIDSISSIAKTFNAKRLSWNHNLGKGQNKILIVSSAVEDKASDAKIASVTFNGKRLRAIKGTYSAAGKKIFTEMYFMLEKDLPPAGTYKISINYRGKVSHVCGAAVSLQNVQQQIPEFATANTAYKTKNISTDIKTKTASSWAVDIIASNSKNNFKTRTGTKRWEEFLKKRSAAGSTMEISNPGNAKSKWQLNSKADKISHSLAVVTPYMAYNNPPEINVIKPLHGEKISHTIETIPIEVKVNDSDGKVELVEFYANNRKIGEEKPVADIVSFPWFYFKEGIYELTSVATDDSGLKTTSKITVIIVADDSTEWITDNQIPKKWSINPVFPEPDDIISFSGPSPSYTNKWIANMELGIPYYLIDDYAKKIELKFQPIKYDSWPEIYELVSGVKGTFNRLEPGKWLFYCKHQDIKFQLKFIVSSKNKHMIPVQNDTDNDNLTDAEEDELGYDNSIPDQNKNGITDGKDLAKKVTGKIKNMPWFHHYGEIPENSKENNFPKDKNYIVYADVQADCYLLCPVCKQKITIGWLYIVNPGQDKEWTKAFKIPLEAWHYLQQGSFNYGAGNCGTTVSITSRINVTQLIKILNL